MFFKALSQHLCHVGRARNLEWTLFLAIPSHPGLRQPSHYVLCITESRLIAALAAAAAKSFQSCPTLCNPIDGSPPGSTVPGILQARTLEWVAISFSNAWKWKVKAKSLSRVWLFAYQAPPSMGFFRQEYWSGCHCLLQLPSPSPNNCS